jgi:hypothetical protein
MSKVGTDKKDAYYFSHDSNAKDDFKCMLLIEELGLEGYGIFWILVETLREQDNYKYPMKLLSSLARKYNTTKAKMEVVVKNYNLFQIEDDIFFFSSSLNRRMEIMNQKREQARLAGIKSGEARRNKKNELTLNGRSTDDEQMLNNKKKVKESKEKEIKKKIGEKILIKKFIESRNITDEFICKITDIQEEQENQFRLVLEDIYDNTIDKAKNLLTYEQLESYINQNKYVEKEY